MFNTSLICYLKPTDACQTKANNKNNTGITGNTSTIGLKIVYASGNFAKRIPSIGIENLS
jgi:hypothetical protein